MVMAKLHMICGNCGRNDNWEWEHVPRDVIDGELMAEETVNIWCRNCSTLHSINDNAKSLIQY